jgi:hypothetical protein
MASKSLSQLTYREFYEALIFANLVAKGGVHGQPHAGSQGSRCLGRSAGEGASWRTRIGSYQERALL